MDISINELQKKIEELENQNSVLIAKNSELQNIILRNENSTQKFSFLINYVTNFGLVLINNDGIIIDYNTKSSEILNIPTTNYKEKRIEYLFNIESKNEFKNLLEKAQKNSNSQNFKTTLKHNDIIKFVEINISKINENLFILQINNTTQNTDNPAFLDELTKNEKKYRFITENITDVIWIHDVNEDKLIYISPSVEKLRGFTPDEVINQSFDDKLVSGSREKTRKLMRERIEEFTINKDSQKVYIDEVEQSCKNGTTVWVEIFNHFRINEENNHIEIIGVSRNINKRKKAELEFNKLLVAVEQSPVTIAITDTSGTIEFVNPAFCKNTGYSYEEAIGQNPKVLKSGKTPPEVYTELWETITSGKTWRGEFINRKKNGDFYSEEAVISPVRDYSGKITNYIAVKNNISEKKYQEELIKLNNERLQHLFNLSQMKETEIQVILEYALEIAIIITRSSVGYIYRYDEDTKMFTLNSWSKNVMNECNIREQRLTYDLDKTGIWGEAVRQRKHILINDFEADNPLKKGYPEGHVKMKRFLTVPVFTGKKIVAVIGVGNKIEPYEEIDIVQLNLLAESVWSIVRKKEDEGKIIQYATELKELNATKDKFFSIIAHDLKNPFNTLLGFSELLTKNAQKYTPDKVEVFASNMYNTAKHAYSLLENLLEWSRLQTGKLSPKFENFQPELLVAEVESLCKHQAQAKQIKLLTFCNTNKSITGDYQMLSTVLRNLVTNAIKFTFRDGKAIITVYEQDNNIIFSVSDTGIGIEEKNIEMLFRIDSKLSKSGTSDEKGTGLGLVLCKEFIEKHKGRIWVESEVGVGSTFSFSLPLNS